MINPKTIELASLPVQLSGKASQQTTKLGKAGEVFGFNFKDFWERAQQIQGQVVSGLGDKNPSTRLGNLLDLKIAQKKQLSAILMSFRKGMPQMQGATILDQLREGLLAKGKPLSKISIKQEDLPLLKELLLHLGFSEKRGDEILKRLAEKNPGGEILLSQFIQHITELGIPKKDSFQHIEPSVIPQLESILRTFGLRPKEVEQILSETRHEQGGLDLRKLVSTLKALHVGRRDEAVPRDLQVASNQISDKLEKVGLHTQGIEKTGQMSLKDFIVALEQKTGTLDDGKHLPADIKETINRILEKVSMPKEHQGPQTPSTSLGKLKINSSTVKEQIVGKDGFLNSVAPSQKKGPFAPHTGKENNQNLLGENKNGVANQIKGLGSPSVGSGDHGSTKGLKSENFGLQTEKTMFNIPNQTTGSGFSETILAVKQNQVPTREVLPAYLVDQLGRQISRSIQRGDRVLKIQLKPPELGVVKVALDLKENVLKLGMITENSAVKELLLANASELREALVEQGVKLEKIDVQIGDHSNQTLSDLKEGLKEGRHGNQGVGKGQSQSTDHRVDGQTDPSTSYRKDQLLDLVA